MSSDNIRNIAIIAHVDHGKTTLVDKMLSQSGAFRENEQVIERVMDSNDLEREKGITILAKNTSIKYKGYKINILDTPGHADFGGEVERIMKMVQGVLLVVDAFEGCMPQTRFVLKKALEQNLIPIVVVNKMDRENARPLEVVDEVLDLFIDLGANEDQLEFPVIYASALDGKAGLDIDNLDTDFVPLFETIVNQIPAPQGQKDDPLQMQVTLLDYNDYLGRIAIGTINRGTMKKGNQIIVLKRDGTIETHRVTKLFTFEGLKRVETDQVAAGDIVALAGMEQINVGETLCDVDTCEPLPLLTIDEPTLQMSFIVNNSPFSGKEGDPVTSRKLGARLMREIETDVSLRVEETSSPDVFLVAGRGELHLAILIETMRREGLEFQVSKPQVITKRVDGRIHEPFENLTIDIPEEYTGSIMEKIGLRKGTLMNMTHIREQVRLEYSIPTRGLVGFRTEFLTDTRGYGILNRSFDSYKPYQGDFTSRTRGVLIAYESGTANTYGLLAAEERGILFIEPGTAVYEGMVVGENSRDQDIVVNICKEKALTNVRSSTKDDTVKLKGSRNLSLEQALAYIDTDEYLELTPKSIRIRKKYLKKAERERFEKNNKKNPVS
ncbi:MAG: GTP-binding protein TypA [Desulfitibacter sp. BRH_c19]|nr:MAG: GTP-binding protein TypA [Desulfitibacter sp. BRH_c19]